MAQERQCRGRQLPPANLVIAAVLTAACAASMVAWPTFDTGADFWTSAFWFCMVVSMGVAASVCVLGPIGVFVGFWAFGVLLALMILL